MFQMTIEADSLSMLSKKLLGAGVAIQRGTHPADVFPEKVEAPQVEAPQVEAPQVEAPQVEAPQALNFHEDVAPKVLDAVSKHGKQPVMALLDEFGVERASQLGADRWAELLSRIQDL